VINRCCMLRTKVPSHSFYSTDESPVCRPQSGSARTMDFRVRISLAARFGLLFLTALLLLVCLTCAEVCYTVYGRSGCWYFEQAKSTVLELQRKNPDAFQNGVIESDSDGWPGQLQLLNRDYGTSHRTSPYIVKGCPGSKRTFVGGRDALLRELGVASNHGELPAQYRTAYLAIFMGLVLVLFWWLI